MNTQSAARDRILTIEEYQSLPEDPCYRYELSQGRLVRDILPELKIRLADILLNI